MKSRTFGLLFIGLGAGLLLGVTGLWLFQRLTPPKGTTQSYPVVGWTAPDFSLESLDGKSYSLAGLRGQPVVINFWATWCDPCKDEMPLLDRAARDYSENLLILGVNAGENTRLVEEFQQAYRLSFPILLDPDQDVGHKWLVNAFPTTYFLDEDGVVRAIQVGILSESVLSERLAQIGVLD